MDIECWDTRNRGALGSLLNQWMEMDTGPLKVKAVSPEQKFLDHLRTLTNRRHSYLRKMRTIIKVNGKYIYLDSVDSPYLSAESWKLPFDLIVKFQYRPNESYQTFPAPVVPFTYTMSHYDMELIEKCWQKRQEVLRTKQFTSSMFWYGKIGANISSRTCAFRHLREMEHSCYEKKVYPDYLSELATTQASVTVAGTGDFTHRDIEATSVGSASVSNVFRNQTRNPRIPNVHYYSIEDNFSAVMTHFCDYFEPSGEYCNFTDEEWEKYCEISYNARKWWEKNASPEGSFNLFREILEEQNIT